MIGMSGALPAGHGTPMPIQARKASMASSDNLPEGGLEFAFVCDGGQERACVGICRIDDGPGFAAFDNSFARVEAETRFLFVRAVAFVAVLNQHRPNLQFKELDGFRRQFLRRRGGLQGRKQIDPRVGARGGLPAQFFCQCAGGGGGVGLEHLYGVEQLLHVCGDFLCVGGPGGHDSTNERDAASINTSPRGGALMNAVDIALQSISDGTRVQELQVSQVGKHAGFGTFG